MMKKKSNLILFALFFLGSVSFSLAQKPPVRGESYEKGKLEAAENLKNEKFVLKVWGLSSSKFYSWESADEIYDRLLKENYEITYEWVGGCMVDEETAEYVEGYNEIMKAGIEAKYGTGILQKVRKQAEDEYETKYGDRQREFNRKLKEGRKILPASYRNLESLKFIQLKPNN